MLEGPLFPNITRFTIPIILTSVLQLLFNAADLVVVGQFCGSVSVAAVGATGSITGLLVNFFIGLSVGAGVAVAHGLGGRENQVVHRTVHTALPTAILSGAILTVAGLTYSETFLIMMGTPDTVLPLSTVYMRIIFCGVTFNMVYNFCASILRAAGDTKSPLVFLLFAGVLNVILNLVFVIQFQMNVAGVALATIISQAVSAVLVVIALMRRTDACKLYLNKLRFYKPQLAKILRIGLPAGISGDEGEESTLQSARRELEEETGYRADAWTYLFTGPSSPGLTTEMVSFYLAEGLHQISEGGGVAHENITVHRIPLPLVHGWLMDQTGQGKVVDPKIFMGLYFLSRSVNGVGLEE